MRASPWAGLSAVNRSDCSVFVGSPVAGPPRWTSMITAGFSVIQPRPMPSPMRVNPGPEVAVMAFLPVNEAPKTPVIDSISELAWSAAFPGPTRLRSR